MVGDYARATTMMVGGNAHIVVAYYDATMAGDNSHAATTMVGAKIAAATMASGDFCTTVTMAGGEVRTATACCAVMMVGGKANFFIYFYSATSKVFNHLLVCLCARKREKESKKEKKRKKVLKPVPGYITPHLVSLFPTPSILALLVGRGVIAQALFNNSNTSSNNSKT
jgi:hypothetical protein